MSDPMNSGTMAKCGYCGYYHSYSELMCRDTMLRSPAPILVPMPELGEAAIRADERKRLREELIAFHNRWDALGGEKGRCDTFALSIRKELLSSAIFGEEP